ncbi:MAG: hypothetical protein MHPSP_000417 [Paramarteilia canceri]
MIFTIRNICCNPSVAKWITSGLLSLMELATLQSCPMTNYSVRKVREAYCIKNEIINSNFGNFLELSFDDDLWSHCYVFVASPNSLSKQPKLMINSSLATKLLKNLISTFSHLMEQCAKFVIFPAPGQKEVFDTPYIKSLSIMEKIPNFTVKYNNMQCPLLNLLKILINGKNSNSSVDLNIFSQVFESFKRSFDKNPDKMLYIQEVNKTDLKSDNSLLNSDLINDKDLQGFIHFFQCFYAEMPVIVDFIAHFIGTKIKINDFIGIFDNIDVMSDTLIQFYFDIGTLTLQNCTFGLEDVLKDLKCSSFVCHN